MSEESSRWERSEVFERRTYCWPGLRAADEEFKRGFEEEARSDAIPWMFWQGDGRRMEEARGVCCSGRRQQVHD